jgi:hypothetical protein
MPIQSYMRWYEHPSRRKHSLLGWISLCGPIYQLLWTLSQLASDERHPVLAVAALLSPAIAIAAIWEGIKKNRRLLIPVVCLCVFPGFLVFFNQVLVGW